MSNEGRTGCRPHVSIRRAKKAHAEASAEETRRHLTDHCASAGTGWGGLRSWSSWLWSSGLYVKQALTTSPSAPRPPQMAAALPWSTRTTSSCASSRPLQNPATIQATPGRWGWFVRASART